MSDDPLRAVLGKLVDDAHALANLLDSIASGRTPPRASAPALDHGCITGTVVTAGRLATSPTPATIAMANPTIMVDTALIVVLAGLLFAALHLWPTHP
jgi:hypothetical protein